MVLQVTSNRIPTTLAGVLRDERALPREGREVYVQGARRVRAQCKSAIQRTLVL